MFKDNLGVNFYFESPPWEHAREYFERWFELAALHQRGWVTQERLLSPRTLNFGPLVIWECHETLLNDQDVSTGPRMITATSNELTLKRRIHEANVTDPTKARETVLGLWNGEILPHYSKSKLTVRSDRLVAVSGIIKIFEERTGWENICGLWEPDMHNQLLWRVYEEGSPRVLGIPTWSWASVETEVYYRYVNRRSDKSSRIFEAQIEVTEVILPKDNANGPVGPVKALRICSFLFNLRKWPHACKRRNCWHLVNGPVPQAHIGDELYAAVLDFDTLLSTPQPEYFFLTLVEFNEKRYGQVFLIVGIVVSKSSRILGAYERVGHGTQTLPRGCRMDVTEEKKISVLVI
jgi:hypothetical protein